MTPRAISLALATVFCLPVPVARASLIIDQANDQYLPILRNSIQGLGPIGESFTPTLTSLNVVELVTGDFASHSNGVGANLFVNVRAGGIAGPILGVSSVVSLPDGFEGVTQFHFASPVALVPGGTYVIEVRVAGGDNWFVGRTDPFPIDPYTRGIPFDLGQPSGPGADLWFREGIQTVPEPGTLFLVIFTGLIGAAIRGRRPVS